MKIKHLLESNGWKVLTKKEAEAADDGGARIGTLDGVSFEDIVAALGPPTIIDRARNSTTTVVWYIQAADGSIVRIYDYKQSRKYNGETELDMSKLHADPEVQARIKARQNKNMTQARKLGIDHIRDWSIGGDMAALRRSINRRASPNSKEPKKEKKEPLLDLVYSIFPDKVWVSTYPSGFRVMFDPDAKPYKP